MQNRFPRAVALKTKATKCQAVLLKKLNYISHIVKQIMECSHCKNIVNYFPLVLEVKYHCLSQKMKLSKCSFYRCLSRQKCFLWRYELENDIEINLEDRQGLHKVTYKDRTS